MGVHALVGRAESVANARAVWPDVDKVPDGHFHDASVGASSRTAPSGSEHAGLGLLELGPQLGVVRGRARSYGLDRSGPIIL